MTVHAPHGIVVGVDESAGAAVALRWAVAESRLHETELTAVLAWGFVDQHPTTPERHFDAGYDSEDATNALRGFIIAAVGEEAAASVHVRTACDLPARALLDASRSADLLVVGARGLGGFRGLLLGSVSQHCLHHTTVPIAIIRALPGPAVDGERMVVGVDGSAAAQSALRWAIAEARRRRTRLDVATVWTLPYAASGIAPTTVFDPSTYEADAARLVEQAISSEDVSGLAHPLHPVTLQGGVTDALLTYSAGATLLVVGSRGHGSLKRALIGSVASQVSHHATCPTVVVPAERKGAG